MHSKPFLFYYQPFIITDYFGNIEADGEPVWKIRFAPNETGNWQYNLRLIDETGSAEYPTQTFECTASDNHGYLRAGNNRYLQFDDGTAYFAIGENMGWYNSIAIYEYRNWMGALADNGGNYIRIWMATWGFSLEWEDTGLGNYTNRQDEAFTLDWVLDFAAQKDIYIMLCLINHGQFSAITNPEWEDNPYNAENGGPCLEPGDFFSNETAISYFKRRMRYIIARWGYSTNLQSWELWNEVSWVDNFANIRNYVGAWHVQMAAFIGDLDVYDHLVSTSFAHTEYEPNTWNHPLIDFTQVHLYITSQNAQNIHHDWTQNYLEQFDKPMIVGEYGFGSLGPDFSIQNDPNGIDLHNSLWAATVSGAFGTAMTWWWDSYIHTQNLYYHFFPVSEFAASLDFFSQEFTPVTLQSEPLRSFALQGQSDIYGWVQNMFYNWERVHDFGIPDSVYNLALTLTDLTYDGFYKIEWRNCSTGHIFTNDTLNATGGQLSFDVPTILWDYAYKLSFIGPTGIEENKENYPRWCLVEQSYPNPFSAKAIIPYSLPGPGRVELSIYNVNGQLVKLLIFLFCLKR